MSTARVSHTISKQKSMPVDPFYSEILYPAMGPSMTGTFIRQFKELKAFLTAELKLEIDFAKDYQKYLNHLMSLHTNLDNLYNKLKELYDTYPPLRSRITAVTLNSYEKSLDDLNTKIHTKINAYTLHNQELRNAPIHFLMGLKESKSSTSTTQEKSPLVSFGTNPTYDRNLLDIIFFFAQGQPRLKPPIKESVDNKEMGSQADRERSPSFS